MPLSQKSPQRKGFRSLMFGLSQRTASIRVTVSMKEERIPCDTEVRKNSQGSSKIHVRVAESGSWMNSFNEWKASKHTQHKYDASWEGQDCRIVISKRTSKGENGREENNSKGPNSLSNRQRDYENKHNKNANCVLQFSSVHTKRDVNTVCG